MHKVGETYSVSFGLLRGTKRRIPIKVHITSHQDWLDALLESRAKAGSIQLLRSRKGIWYACISVSVDVPGAEVTGRWLGIDRRQNIPAAVATPDGPVVFYKLQRIRHIRQMDAKRRKRLQQLGQFRAIEKLESRERRIVTHFNHVVSTDIVALAARQNAGIRRENLAGIRQRSKQRKDTRADAGQHRNYCRASNWNRSSVTKRNWQASSLTRFRRPTPASHAESAGT